LIGLIQATEISSSSSAKAPHAQPPPFVNALDMQFRELKLAAIPNARSAAKSHDHQLIDYQTFCGATPSPSQLTCI